MMIQKEHRQHRTTAFFTFSAWLFLAVTGFLVSDSFGKKPDIDAVKQRVREKKYSFEVGENPATQYSLDQLCGLKVPLNLQTPLKDTLKASPEDLPDNFDWRTLDGCTPVKNQGGCGSCWAFAAMGVAESQYLIQSGETLDFSEQWLVSCTEAGSCDGGWHGAAFNYMIDTADAKGLSGTPLEENFPYEADDVDCDFTDGDRYLLTSWAGITENIDAMKEAIMTYGPIAVSIYAEDLFQCYVGGIFDADISGSSNHAVVLVGWDDTQGSEGVWYLRNSWGTGWGENGYMRIEYGSNGVGESAAYAEYLPPEDPNMVTVPDMYATIQSAVTAVPDGGTVVLSPGTYSGAGNVDIDFGGKSVTIRSQTPHDVNNVIIDCEGSVSQPRRAFQFLENDGQLIGLTIRNGYQLDNGGAIYCFYSNPTFTNCRFENNTATGYRKAGGAIALYNSNPIISECVFDNNYASSFGGALSCRDSSSPEISDSRIINNTAGIEGGGIYCWVNSMANIEHTVIANNHADDAGGGLFFYECADAQAVGDGEPNRPSVEFCTITDNTTGGYGGGLFCMDSIVSIRNSILWNNTGGQALGDEIAMIDDSLSGTAVFVNYCDVTGLDQGHYLEANCTLEWGDGNINADPLFVDAAGGDYHLKSASGHWDEITRDWILDDGGNYNEADDENSPCIDAGDPELGTGDEFRCNGGIVNIGVYGVTAQASRSPHEKCCMGCMQADFNCDCKIDLVDLMVIAEDWLKCNLLPRYYCAE